MAVSVPQFLPFLIYKKERAEWAMEIVRLKREAAQLAFGNTRHPSVAAAKVLWDRLKEANRTAYANTAEKRPRL
jgi:hypothetical protein